MGSCWKGTGTESESRARYGFRKCAEHLFGYSDG